MRTTRTITSLTVMTPRPIRHFAKVDPKVGGCGVGHRYRYNVGVLAKTVRLPQSFPSEWICRKPSHRPGTVTHHSESQVPALHDPTAQPVNHNAYDTAVLHFTGLFDLRDADKTPKIRSRASLMNLRGTGDLFNVEATSAVHIDGRNR